MAAATALGIAMVVVFFVAMLVFGIIISWRTNRAGQTSKSMMIGNNDIGLFVGTLTLSATWVGTAYIVSVAEQIYTPGAGLIWTLAPCSMAITCLINSFFIIPKLRDVGFITILDPIQNKLGKELNGMFYVLAVSTDIIWIATILKSLGGAIATITGLNNIAAIATSATFALAYTVLGGLYAVAYTDVLQFGLILLGLILGTPFVLNNEAIGDLAGQIGNTSKHNWLGTLDGNVVGYWADSLIMMCLGFVVYQGLYQRVFAMKSLRKAQIATVLSSVVFLVAGIPAVLVGMAATKTNWTMVGYIDGISNNNTPIENNDCANIFPIMIQHLAPEWVACIVLSSLSAAAMSSADSAILSSSSLFTQNVYKAIIRKQASDRELLWANRASMFVGTLIGALLGTALNSVYTLWYISADLLYVLLLPQFIGVIYFDVNGYGSIVSVVFALIMRIACGEPLFNFPGLFVFPGNEPPNSQFPVKTFLMLLCLANLCLFSYIFKKLFQAKVIPKKYDFLDSNLDGKGRSYIHGKITDVSSALECNESLVFSERKKQCS